MEILLAEEMGFCWGVRRAIEMMERAAQERGPIVSIGPIVHNPQVVRDLERKGVRVGEDLSQADSLPAAITAHGAPPELLRAMQARRPDLIDTTCPIVVRSQRWARKMAQSGYTVIIFGDPQHREVKGVLGWASGKGIAISDGEPIPEHLPPRLAVISQTTQSPQRFAHFVSTLLQERGRQIGELRVVNTLCNVTSRQQQAARNLARRVDLVLVVGGRNSANSRHLLEVCQEEGTRAFLLESAEELRPEWLVGCRRVGITAGASTPDSAVQAVVRRLRELSGQAEATATGLRHPADPA